MTQPAAAIALTTDLYELTMAASYHELGMNERATFSLVTRRLPRNRSFLVVAGLEDALDRLQSFRFDAAAIDYLRRSAPVRPELLEHLEGLRFTGDIWAVPEGRVMFAHEPFLEVDAPLIEAQLVETMIMNAIHYPTLVATKAARCGQAAPGKSLVDFGLRRDPGIEAGLAAARAAYLAGFAATSNLLAGQRYGIPVAGTLAHSFIEAFPSEIHAFEAFARTFPGEATLLIDTYDTIVGAQRAIEISGRLRGTGVKLAALRLDSGDIADLSHRVRGLLDQAGLENVGLFATGGLDEFELERLVAAGSPIDGYGIGTRLGTSSDAPVLDLAYKLAEYAGEPRLKLSSGKETIAGPKQVWRRRGRSGSYAEDLIGTRDELRPGERWEPVMELVMDHGESQQMPSLDEIRERHQLEISRLPPALLRLRGSGGYRVRLSPALQARQTAAAAAVRARQTPRRKIQS